MTEPWSARRAREIANRALNEGYDIFLACRELDRLADGLSEVSGDVMDVFKGVSSEVDALPLGAERRLWSPEAVRAKDVEASEYREQIRDAVNEALRVLLAELDEPNGSARVPRNSGDIGESEMRELRQLRVENEKLRQIVAKLRLNESIGDEARKRGS